MSYDHGTTNVKFAEGQIQPLRGATFSPHSPPEGPARVLWDLLNMLVALVVGRGSDPPDAQIAALRLANGLLLSGWRVWSTMEEEARYASAGTTGWQGVELEAARADLCRIGAALRELERQLVGDPPPTEPPPRTMTVRPKRARRSVVRERRAS